MTTRYATRHATGIQEYRAMSTTALREAFLIDTLFSPGEIRMTYWETDRTVVGSIVPQEAPLQLEAFPGLASTFFCERREAGVLNLGGPGRVAVDGTEHRLARLDALYLGRGSREVVFTSEDAAAPARFYLVSYPAHASLPTLLIPQAQAREVRLGTPEEANARTIRQFIHEEGAPGCQLVLGYTRLEPGSVWNTFPPHTHLRRSEVYLYFDLPEEAAVFHLMGEARETRHLVVRDGQAVLSPPWSIHSGCGTRAYSFVWAMGGENRRFTDMDGIAVGDLR